MMRTAQQLAAEIGNTRRACDSLGVSRSSLHRWERDLAGPPRPVQISLPCPSPARTLSSAERQAVLDVLHEPRFADKAPAQVHAALLDEGRYPCALRTMHRVLEKEHESGERRRIRRHAPAAIPRLVARKPHDVWTWDITKLLGPAKGILYALYVVLDLFSRHVVAWTVARRELASIAEDLLRTACENHGVQPESLTIHSDRGAPMTAKSVAVLFVELGITASLSRPRVSNDNPYAEAQFRTAKDDWNYPGRFDSIEHARAWAGDFLHRYNTQHYHSGLAMLTPEVVFTGRAEEVLDQRREVLRAAYEAHPERFVRGVPQPPELPKEVWINPLPRALVTVAGQ